MSQVSDYRYTQKWYSYIIAKSPNTTEVNAARAHRQNTSSGISQTTHTCCALLGIYSKWCASVLEETMAEKESASGFEGPTLETFKFSAGSYDRLKTNEEELFELVKLSEVPIDKQLFKVILELLKINVAPAAILQVLKSLRPQSTPDDLGSQSPVAVRTAAASHPRIHSKHPSSSSSPSESSSSLPFQPASHTSSDVIGNAEVAVHGLKPDQSEPGKDGKARSGRSSSSGKSREHKHKSTSGSKGRSKDTGVAKPKAKQELEPL